MNRSEMLARALDHREPWDLLVIGGGATGTGVAVDAAARGYRVLLLERGDFGSGTSSRSTKLVHGGVRYLRQGHVGLVYESLRERGRLRGNAPHLIHDLTFVLPCYGFGERLFYGLGLNAYDLLARRYRFGHSRIVSAAETRHLLPTIRSQGLRGGVVYHDGQFDDSRLVIHLAMTAADHGAIVLNYCEAAGLIRGDGAVRGVRWVDRESGQEQQAMARVVVNAAGPFCDAIRHMAGPVSGTLIAASQGSHVVLARSFLPGDSALLVPRTPDGRVLFAIPWHGHTLVGTTDVPLSEPSAEPRPTEAETDFILETAAQHLDRTPRREDVLSRFAGIRPLVRSGEPGTAQMSRSKKTSSLSRDFVIRVDAPGLVTIAGGKWTTYRAMAEACVDRAAELADLPPAPCPTTELSLHGYTVADDPSSLAVYGSDAAEVQRLAKEDPTLGEVLDPRLPYIAAEVVWAVRAEMARTVEDVLARRTRALFLNAAAASDMAPRVAELMRREFGRDEAWREKEVRNFGELSRGYGVSPPS